MTPLEYVAVLVVVVLYVLILAALVFLPTYSPAIHANLSDDLLLEFSEITSSICVKQKIDLLCRTEHRDRLVEYVASHGYFVILSSPQDALWFRLMAVPRD